VVTRPEPPMTVLSLFSGIGGLDLGLQRAGMTIAGQVEIDPWCRKILAKHWPEVPRHDDVRTAAGWWGQRTVPDLVAGGFPCQPVSDAGLRLAQSDSRWLWPPMADVIAQLSPGWVVIENVPGLRTRGLAIVLRDLRRLGYRTAPGTISACEMGAPYPRKRLFVLAHAESAGCGARRRIGSNTAAADGERPDRPRPDRRSWWSDEPRLDRVAYGLPGRVDRVRALGNAVVPQVAEHVGRLILAAGNQQARAAS
jgi:DNA (cytosine-5)-methyltransferase 1